MASGHGEIRVAVYSRRRLFRDVLVGYLRTQADHDVVGHAGDLEDLVALCGLCHPHVVLFDADRGIALTPYSLTRVRRCVACSPIVVIYDALSPTDATALLRMGVNRFVPKSHGIDALLIVLRRCAVDARTTPYGDGDGLTGLEREIIALVGAGNTAGQVAGLLGVTTSTVTNAKRRIQQKLHVSSQAQTVARAAALGITTGLPVEASEMPDLTSRENDILCSIAAGHTVRQTARLLGIAEKTVENTQARLFRKLGARNRCGALSAAHALGLMDSLGGAATRNP